MLGLGAVLTQRQATFRIIAASTAAQHTTAYHPQTDGSVKRFNRTLTAMLAKTVEGGSALFGGGGKKEKGEVDLLHAQPKCELT